MLDWLASLSSFGASPTSAPAVASPVPAALGDVDPSFLDGLLGYTNNKGFQPGWGGAALGALQGIGNAFMGMKQYGLAEDALKEQKRQFNLNYGAQKSAFNSQIEDRQRARVAANPGAYDDAATYMKKYGL